jgi:biopolymer transport protein ExbD
MKVRNRRPLSDKVPLDMTPMIDIVFQLQAFFIMTFSISANEGDFSIKMPIAAPSEGTPDEELLPPIKVELRAGASGGLAQITMGDREVGNFQELRGAVQGMVGGGGGAEGAGAFEVEFICDYNLHYEHVIAAITAVTGYRDRNGTVVKLIEKIKFAPPKKQAG